MTATATAPAPVVYTNGTDVRCADHAPDALIVAADTFPRRKSHRIDGAVWSVTDAACDDKSHTAKPARKKTTKPATAPAKPAPKPAPKTAKAAPKPAPKVKAAPKPKPAPKTAKPKPAPKADAAGTETESFYVIGAAGFYVEAITKDDVTIVKSAKAAKRFKTEALALSWARRANIVWLDDDRFMAREVRNGRVVKGGTNVED